MKKMTIAALSLLALSANTMAAKTNSSTTTLKGYYDQLKASPFSLSYLADAGIKRKMDGITVENLFYLNYKSQNNKFSIIPDFVMSHTGDEKDAHLEYDHVQLRYTRSNILTEEENGVKLNAQLRGYALNDESRNAGSDTILRPYIEFSKTFGKFKLLNANSLYLYQTNDVALESKKDVKETRLLVQVTPSYKISDKIKISTDVLYYHENFVKDDSNSVDKLRLVPSIAYSFDNGIGVSAYLDATPMKSKGDEGMKTIDGWERNTSVGGSLFYTIF